MAYRKGVESAQGCRTGVGAIVFPVSIFAEREGFQYQPTIRCFRKAWSRVFRKTYCSTSAPLPFALNDDCIPVHIQRSLFSTSPYIPHVRTCTHAFYSVRRHFFCQPCVCCAVFIVCVCRPRFAFPPRAQNHAVHPDEPVHHGDRRNL